VVSFVRILLLASLLTALVARADSPSDKAALLTDRGDFKGAAAVLNEALKSSDLSSTQRKALAFQLDILNRIQEDYSLTRADLFEKLSASVKNLTKPEFDRWITEGRFDSKVIDGQTWFVNTSALNLYYRYPSLQSRQLDRVSDVAEQKGRLAIGRQIKKKALATHNPYVLPHRFACTMSVTVAKNAAPQGETIRAWLPIPRQYTFQDGFKLISSSPAVKELGLADSPIRSAYLEEAARADNPSEFSVTYSYTRYGISFDLRPEESRPADLTNPELKKFTSESPHVVFTEKIKALANEIAGHETNQLVEARAFYDWIGSHIQYSYAREYSTLANLSDYCLTNRYGDCGQEAMLFMTLCRSRGIPARWETGWDLYPGSKSMHDWSQVYLAPYGWVPVDPWAGIFSTQECTALTDAERRELHDFYFGGLDYYRMTANSDHSQELDPPKRSMRSDDIDFQRGELEWGDHNIYFDKYTFDLNVEEMR
jgi:transglutaminase-like putative cysteine protease